MRGWVVAWLVFFPVAVALGQQQVSAATAAALVALGSRASVIFSGQVLEIDRNDEDGFVDILFHVEQAVRGCSAGSTYGLREWAGLWIGQPERYRSGQRLLMVLAARGASGMSAPVGGLAGVIPVIAGRMPPLIHGKTAPAPDTAAAAAAGDGVDLRWVQALWVQRRNTAKGAAASAAAESQVELWRGPVEPLPVVPKEPTLGPSLSAVMALLGQGSGG